MTTADVDGEKSTCRCVDAARYVVAAAVTVLIMAVIVNAVKVVLRPESLQLSVAGGSVFSGERSPPDQQEEALLAFRMNLRAHNPSGRARMYYLNVTAYFFDNNTTSASASSAPADDSIFYFPLADIAVFQQETVDSWVAMKLEQGQVTPPYFDMLYNGSSISDVTLRLDGDLVTEVTSKLNETRYMTSYYCEQLLVGGDSDELKNRQDVMCKQQGS